MRVLRILLAGGLLLLAACAGPGVKGIPVLNGSGDVTMSPSAYAAFNAYRAKADPMVFALSPDGKQYYWQYCIAFKTECDIEAYMQDAVTRCSQQGSGQTCRIFARRKAVVWRNPGDFAPS